MAISTSPSSPTDTPWKDHTRIRRIEILHGGHTDPDTAEHPTYKRSDWKSEVMIDNTLTGYWEWVSFMVYMVEGK